MNDFRFEMNTKTGEVKFVTDKEDIVFKGVGSFEFDGRYLKVTCNGDDKGAYAYMKPQRTDGEREEE